MGIPKEEIAFVHEAKNDKQKEKLRTISINNSASTSEKLKWLLAYYDII